MKNMKQPRKKILIACILLIKEDFLEEVIVWGGRVDRWRVEVEQNS